MSVSVTFRKRASSLISRSSLPVRILGIRHPDILAHLGGDETVIPRNNFQRNTKLLEAVNCFGNPFFWRIEENQKTEECHVLFTDLCR